MPSSLEVAYPSHSSRRCSSLWRSSWPIGQLQQQTLGLAHFHPGFLRNIGTMESTVSFHVASHLDCLVLLVWRGSSSTKAECLSLLFSEPLPHRSRASFSPCLFRDWFIPVLNKGFFFFLTPFQPSSIRTSPPSCCAFESCILVSQFQHDRHFFFFSWEKKLHSAANSNNTGEEWCEAWACDRAGVGVYAPFLHLSDVLHWNEKWNRWEV